MEDSNMNRSYPNLFAPGRIGLLEIPNRIVMPPMGTGFSNPDGRVTPRQIDYYAARARGGTGLIIVEGVKVENRIDPLPAHPNAGIYSDSYIAGFADLADAVHDYGAKLALQLTVGNGRQSFVVSPENPPISASAIPTFVNPNINCRPLSKHEIEELVHAFGVAARRARAAGVDMVEIHGHGGYLIDQFMTGLWNKRTDEYGGDLDGRMRFVMEIIQSIKQAAGPDFPISFRYGVEHRIPGGRDVAESQEIARRLQAAGVDVLHADAGCYETSELFCPASYLGDACLADMAARLKDVVQIPVIAVGSIPPDAGEALLKSGQADFIASGRGLIADPDWPEKVRAGNMKDVRPCIRCNEMCIGRISKLKPISCSVNPLVGKERYYNLNKSDHARKVLIVGGGPAGLEAARVAAVKGHHVMLFEKDNFLGGQLRAAARTPFKKELRQLIDWWESQLRKLGVNVRLQTEATPDLIAAEQPDAVVVATGARPVIPDIPGIGGENIIRVVDYHLGKKPASGTRIVVAGGGLAGCDAALELARDNHQMTIVEMLSRVAREITPGVRNLLLKLLKENGVRTLTDHRITEFRKDGVCAVKPDGSDVTIPADSVILAMGVKSENSLFESLRDIMKEVYLVGDGSCPAKVGDAVHSGFVAGWRI
jgi:2-enoate reductase